VRKIREDLEEDGREIKKNRKRREKSYKKGRHIR
jgi:hypothetical protein